GLHREPDPAVVELDVVQVELPGARRGEPVAVGRARGAGVELHEQLVERALVVVALPLEPTLLGPGRGGGQAEADVVGRLEPDPGLAIALQGLLLLVGGPGAAAELTGEQPQRAGAGQTGGAQRLLGPTLAQQQLDQPPRASIALRREALAALAERDPGQLILEQALGLAVAGERGLGAAERLEGAAQA